MCETDRNILTFESFQGAGSFLDELGSSDEFGSSSEIGTSTELGSSCEIGTSTEIETRNVSTQTKIDTTDDPQDDDIHWFLCFNKGLAVCMLLCGTGLGVCMSPILTLFNKKLIRKL